jgi:hypothetical protein
VAGLAGVVREVTVALEALRQRLRRNCLTRPRPAVVVLAALITVVVAIVIGPQGTCIDEEAERRDRGRSRHDT